MHKSITLPILYFGTPVVLISTTNEDGSVNIAPSSSIWWLGQSCMVGLDGSSKTTENLKNTRECVVNLASAEQVQYVDKIANTTGSKSVPLHKKRLGYRYEADKINVAGLSVQKSEVVAAPRLNECQVQLEAKVEKIHAFSNKSLIPLVAFEMSIVKTHVDDSILMPGQHQYVDPDKWHPLIMSFRKFYTTNDYIHPSRLAEGSAERYHVRDLSGFKGRAIRSVINQLYKKFII